MTARASDALVMRGVGVTLGGASILSDVDLRVGRHERWILLGPNGSGKTTLLALAGARRHPSAGTVAVLGLQLGRFDVRRIHSRIGHCSHVLTEMMPPSLRVEDVVLTGKRSSLVPWFESYGPGDRERARSLLRDVGCGDLADRVYATLSQGERQRVVLARALYREPDLLILDEPAAGLDFPARERLIAALETAARGSRAPAFLMATHHLEEVPPSTTHAALLRAGGLVAAGPVEDVLTRDRLRECFRIPLDVERRNGRWTAFAGP